VGAKYYFYTDPALLTAQTGTDAFGPAASADGNDLFRVTDTHRTSADAPVFAVCDGLLCAQRDDQNTLTLILKPAAQPPFDFPTISYVLYKGVDPASLLDGNGNIDTQQTGNPLIDAIKAAWQLPANANGTATPDSKCLGLHLNPVDYTQTDNPARFADTEPLDQLFYNGDPLIQLPLVHGGWKLARFAAGAACGMEIIVERIGYRSSLALARTAVNILTVTSLDSATIYAPNDAAAFAHWNAKEACLNFVDPCALWGSFFAANLRVWNGTDFVKASGDTIYTTVLRGAAQGATHFANRNRAYIDIRNEHGRSINYYKTDGPNIQLTLDPSAGIDTCEVNYYASGWPCFWVDTTSLPAGATGTQINARFALPKTTNTRPLIYVSVGYRGAFRTLKERQRFLDLARRRDSSYLFETSITLPLADDNGVARLLAGYNRLHQFKRLAIVDGQPVPPADPACLAPLRATALECLLPLLTPDDLPVTEAPVILKTYDDLHYVEPGASDGDGFVASPAVAADNINVVLALVPRAHNTPAAALRPTPVKVAWPSLVLPGGEDNVFAYLSKLLPTPLNLVEVADPETSGDQIELLYAGSTAGIYQDFVRNNPSAVSINLSRMEIADLHAIVASGDSAIGTPMLSLSLMDTYRDDVTSYVGFALSVNLLAGMQTVARLVQPSQIRVYRHEVF